MGRHFHKTLLVMFPLDAGRRLIAALDAAHFDFRAAFWLYRSEADDWRLYIASPIVDEIGPLKTYKRIQDVLLGLDQTDNNPFDQLSLSNITVVSPRNPLVRALRKAAHVGPGDQEVRICGNAIDNIYVDEAYIYRML